MTSIERHEARFARRKAKRDAKRVEDLGDALDFDAVFSFIHLYRSAWLCFKGVRWKGSVQAYKSRCGMNVARRWREMQNGVYKLKACPEFYVRERGHIRRINSIAIGDRIPQKCNSKYALKPVLHRSLIYDNYASQEGKGTSLARKRIACHLQRHIRKYGISGGMIIFDFKGFFDSIPHWLVRQCLEKNFDDQRIVDFNMKTVQQYRDEVGLILGSENSQDFAIYTPNAFDHYILEMLNVESSCRYMDDGMILDPDYEHLKTVYAKIQEKAESLGFHINMKKTRLLRFGQPFTILQRKYDITDSGHILVRPARGSVIRERRKLKRMHNRFLEGTLPLETSSNSVQAWKSSIAGTKCYTVVQSIEKLYDKLFIEEWLSGEERYQCSIKSCPTARSSTLLTA